MRVLTGTIPRLLRQRLHRRQHALLALAGLQPLLHRVRAAALVERGIKGAAEDSLSTSWRIGDQMVAAMGVLWSAADFRHQATLYERRETRSGGARRQTDSLGYLGR